MTAKQRQQQQTKKYRKLIEITEQVVDSARAVLKQTQKARGKNAKDDLIIPQIRQEIDHYCQLGDCVLGQARRRVLEGEQVPDADKVYSIFEPHTDLIKRGKVQTPVEFGHKVFLAESAQGLMNGKTSEMWSCHQSSPFHRGFVIDNSTFESVRVIQAI
jgi:transposase, IS5 family